MNVNWKDTDVHSEFQPYSNSKLKEGGTAVMSRRFLGTEHP
jgi:hypothetical protein